MGNSAFSPKGQLSLCSSLCWNRDQRARSSCFEQFQREKASPCSVPPRDAARPNLSLARGLAKRVPPRQSPARSAAKSATIQASSLRQDWCPLLGVAGRGGFAERSRIAEEGRRCSQLREVNPKRHSNMVSKAGTSFVSLRTIPSFKSR